MTRGPNVDCTAAGDPGHREFAHRAPEPHQGRTVVPNIAGRRCVTTAAVTCPAVGVAVDVGVPGAEAAIRVPCSTAATAAPC
jgi:hypothetical protein